MKKNEVSPTQIAILQTAANSTTGSINPLPIGLKGGAVKKVLDSLMAKNLIGTDGIITMNGMLYIDPDWQSTRAKYLSSIDPAGRIQTAAAKEADFAASQGLVWDNMPLTIEAITEEAITEEATKSFAYRAGCKQAQAIDLMKRTKGATNEQIAAITGWQPHTIRGFISLAKKKGISVTTQRLRVVGPNQQGSPGSFTTYFVK